MVLNVVGYLKKYFFDETFRNHPTSTVYRHILRKNHRPAAKKCKQLSNNCIMTSSTPLLILLNLDCLYRLRTIAHLPLPTSEHDAPIKTSALLSPKCLYIQPISLRTQHPLRSFCKR
ncbi:hypothetical protein TNCV_2244411 [Trichonephila clavipes]|nr:hypothetical protein TNCV_2244411 [Trichonephila clavipes]